MQISCDVRYFSDDVIFPNRVAGKQQVKKNREDLKNARRVVRKEAQPLPPLSSTADEEVSLSGYKCGGC